MPNDAAFQRRVVLAALRLLVEDGGPPLLRDYAVDVPAAAGAMEGWACPLDLPHDDAAGEAGSVAAAFEREMEQMRSWYDLARQRRGATTVGTSGVAVQALAGFIGALLSGLVPPVADDDIPLARRVNLVADDIRAVYAEALTAQPGQEAVTGERLADWFYTETAAGRALYALRRHADDAAIDEQVRAIAGGLAFPARLAGKG